MQIEQLETFLDLLESRNFNRTAERLGITQSTVSARTRALEQAVGCRLFTRGRGGAEPTAAGRQFEAHARSIKATWTLARQNIAVLDRFDGLLRIAAQVSLIETLLFAWIDWLRAKVPRASIHVEADYSIQMVTDLSNGALDIGVVYTPRYLPEIVYDSLMTEQFELMATFTDRLADITPEHYIRVGYSPGFDRAHAELLPHLTRTPFSVGLGVLARAYLRTGAYAAYLPRSAAEPLIRDGSVRPVADAPVIPQPIYAASHVRRRHMPLTRIALQGLKQLAIEQEASSVMKSD